MATCDGNRLPTQEAYKQQIEFLIHNQFPTVLDKSVRYFASLPVVGRYNNHVSSGIRDYDSALHDINTREYTLSGIGSLIDYDTFGRVRKRPTPQLLGSGCNANSLCLDPVCYGFTEGVIESNNMLMSLCWSLAMPCLKDFYYSDRNFDKNIKRYIAMFFKQPAAVLEAFMRTLFLKESIKIVCTTTNFRFTGTGISNSDGISLPFYMNTADPTAFPTTTQLTNAGTDIGGANLSAFANFLAPNLFSGSFRDGMESVRMYGLKRDYVIAKEQTASVVDHYMDMEIIRNMYMSGMMNPSLDKLDSFLGGNFTVDNLLPTLGVNATTTSLEPIVAEILQASTIAGFMQKNNPEHSFAKYRMLMFIPENWKVSLVEPAKDDFSYLGLGQGLNFYNNTPGAFPLMSSSLFSNNTLGEDGVLYLGQGMGSNGMMSTVARGLQPRDRVIREAVRTIVRQTYSNIECNDIIDGQLPRVGRQIVPQGVADGFEVKSTMNVMTDVTGEARPVCLIFKTDTPRSAKPIIVCDEVEIEVGESTVASITDCCPGGQIYAILTFNQDVSSSFTVADTAVLRTGAKGISYLVEVTAVSGNVVTVTSADGETIINCCSGSPDDYGTRTELINTTDPTATSSEIFGVLCDPETGVLSIELHRPIVASTSGDAGTITLENGDVIEVVTSADASGVFVTVELAPAEAVCTDLCILCTCYARAVFALTPVL